MADKIDQLTIGSSTYDIDLPADATPSITSLTASGAITGGSIKKSGGTSSQFLMADGSTANTSTYANQNAFGYVAAGSVNIVANTSQDTLTINGNNVTITGDASNNNVTIGLTNQNVVSALGYTPGTGSGNVADVQVNGTSILDNSNVANLLTKSAYSSGNKLATIADIPTGEINISFNGTATSNTTTLSNVIVGGVTYKAPQGTVKKVNNVSPDNNGNVTITIPAGDNQTIKVDSTTFGANDVISLVGGTDITLTPDATNKTITINSTSTGTITDVKIGSTSIVSGGVATLNTMSTYNASSNKIATKNDLPPTITITNTSSTKSVSDGSNTLTFGSNAFNSTTIPTTYISSASYNSSTKKLTITPSSGNATEITFGSNAFNSTAIPTVYLKNASVNSAGNTLTLTKQDDSTITFTPPLSGNQTITAKNGSATSVTTFGVDDAVEIVAGSNITLGTNATNKTITINGTANTTYSFAEGSTNGAFSVTPSGGTAQAVKIHGLGTNAYTSTAIPTTYVVSASVSGDTLTLTPAEGAAIEYAPSGANTWRPIKLNGAEKLGTDTDTGALNIKAGTNFSITESSGTFTFDIGSSVVTGSSLTANQIALGNGNSTIKISSYKPTASGTTWSTTSDVNIPTMKAISNYVSSLGYTSNEGTVTSVALRNGSTSQGTLTIAGSAITTSGTIDITLADAYGDTKNPYGKKSPNFVLAGPSSGDTTAVPTFRALVKADIPLKSETAAQSGTTTSLVTTGEKYTWNSKSTVSVSAAGSATNEVNYITINGTTYKLPAGSGGTITDVKVNNTSVVTNNIANITDVPWSIISNKPTIPATNVIPESSTANKILLSTATAGTAAWSSAAKGSTTKPIYLNNSGVLSEGSSYAGGTKVTLNGTDKGESTASFYAPAEGGTSKTILVGNGASTAPVWSSGTTWSGNAGFLKVNASGVTSVDTTSYSVVSASTSTVSGATEIKSIKIGTTDYNLPSGGVGTVTSVCGVSPTNGNVALNHSNIGAGNLTVGNGSSYLNMRSGHDSYDGGIYYSTPGNEAMVFAVKNSVTSFIFKSGLSCTSTGTSWQTLTPDLQIKNGKVVINKLIADGTNASYNLDVNGSINGTTVTIATKATMQYDTNSDCVKFVFA